MEQFSHQIEASTRGPGLYELTREVTSWAHAQGLAEGLLTLFVRHTSASLLIQENADPDVLEDLKVFFSQQAPADSRLYHHTAEGPDDMPAHIKSALTATQLCVPIRDGRLVLGTWQGIYLFEHRTRPHTRRIALHVIGA
jgi:secondary thiamine-phosphate synthase enzyme